METQDTKWILFSMVKPPENTWLETKIDDQHGIRNVEFLKWNHNLFWQKDGMYVYYTPTHWRLKDSCNY